jgi:limonene-1,2-epoxide hydrolase
MISSTNDNYKTGKASISQRGILTAVGVILAAGTISAASTTLAQEQDGNMSDNEAVIREFIAAWSNLDAAELAGYFTEGGTYHNMMLDPVTGREAVGQFIGGFIANWSETNWELLSIASRGDIVIAERVDRTRIGDKHVDLPCVGVFEMQDGNINVWRDYFDLATYSNAFTE